MGGVSNRWALILAAGAGSRLSSLTSIGDGMAVPKQFCSLAGGASLLEETIERAASVAGLAHTIVVVAAEQRAYWEKTLHRLPRHNVVVQPRNRGTANGILLGVAAVIERDPEAVIVALPSDHFVEQEPVLRRAILRAFGTIMPAAQGITFLGIRPDRADPELGYIVRGLPAAGGGYSVAEFVEKPCYEAAAELLQRAALWNSFILVGRARAFADLIAVRYPNETAALLDVMRGGPDQRRADALERLYERLPDIDFSKHVVERSDAPLAVVPVSACGWSDLGTPRRVAECLDRLGARRMRAQSAHLSLSEAHSRMARHAAAAAQSA